MRPLLKENPMKIIAPTMVERVTANIKFRIALAKAPSNIVIEPTK